MSQSRYPWSFIDTFLLYIPMGWLILINRHWNYYHQNLRRPAWRAWERIFFLIPFGFYMALILRALRENFFVSRSDLRDQPAYESCEICGETCVLSLQEVANYQDRVSDDIADRWSKTYFQTELFGIEKLPDQGPAIVMMNHAGAAFPWDLIMFGSEVVRKSDRPLRLWAPVERALTQNALFQTLLPKRWIESIGGVEATYKNFEKLMAHGEISLYAPEGAAGMAKGWGKRYQLAPFHTSFVKLASKYRAKIVPVVCIGNEALHPWTFNIPWMAKVLNLPFFPVSPFVPFLIPFPSLFVFAVSTRFKFYILDPIELPEGLPEEKTQNEWQAMADQIKADLQQQIDRFRSEQ